MKEATVSESLLNDANEQLETVPTLVTLVHTLDLTRILQNKDYEYFERREYDSGNNPIADIPQGYPETHLWSLSYHVTVNTLWRVDHITGD